MASNGSLAALVCALSCAWPAHAGCADASLEWSARQVWNRSQWTEADSSGQTLLTERGVFSGAELELGLKCDDWGVVAGLTQMQGRRAYEGLTSTGLAASTSSGVRVQQLRLEGQYGLATSWHAVGRIENQRLQREIESIPLAAGYPEQFDQVQLLVGASWQAALGAGQMRASLLTGGAIGSRMRLTLPGKDAAELPLGQQRTWEMALGWTQPLGHEWRLQSELRHRRTSTAAGDQAVITRFGLPVAVAHQPAIRSADTALSFGVTRSF